jgi:hypothetical protein
MSKRAAVQRWMNRVAQLPCALCGGQSEHLHHIREGQGAAQKAPDTLVIPLCQPCHLGPEGIHNLGRKGLYMRHKKDELDLIAKVIEDLA